MLKSYGLNIAVTVAIALVVTVLFWPVRPRRSDILPGVLADHVAGCEMCNDHELSAFACPKVMALLEQLKHPAPAPTGEMIATEKPITFGVHLGTIVLPK